MFLAAKGFCDYSDGGDGGNDVSSVPYSHLPSHNICSLWMECQHPTRTNTYNYKSTNLWHIGKRHLHVMMTECFPRKLHDVNLENGIFSCWIGCSVLLTIRIPYFIRMSRIFRGAHYCGIPYENPIRHSYERSLPYKASHTYHLILSWLPSLLMQCKFVKMGEYLRKKFDYISSLWNIYVLKWSRRKHWTRIYVWKSNRINELWSVLLCVKEFNWFFISIFSSWLDGACSSLIFVERGKLKLHYGHCSEQRM